MLSRSFVPSLQGEECVNEPQGSSDDEVDVVLTHLKVGRISIPTLSGFGGCHVFFWVPVMNNIYIHSTRWEKELRVNKTPWTLDNCKEARSCLLSYLQLWGFTSIQVKAKQR